MGLRIVVAGAVALPLALSGSSARSQEVTVRETFLDAPTEWCPPDFGVPVIVSVEGLVIHAYEPYPTRRTLVAVRRGGAPRDVQAIEAVPGDRVRVRRGVEGRDVPPFSVNAEEQLQRIGVMSAEGHLCVGPRDRREGDVAWRIRDEAGAVVIEGRARSPLWWWHVSPEGAGTYPTRLGIGDAQFVVAERPRITVTTEAFAAPRTGNP